MEVGARRNHRGIVAGAALALAAACGGRPLVEMRPAGTGGLTIGQAGAGGGLAGGAPGTAGAGGASGRAGSCGLTDQCADGLDNDGDGKVDYDDPECIGGADNDESSFGDGIPGDNIDTCTLDCFFDRNGGMGDDNCTWRIKCDPASTNPSCPHDPSYVAEHPVACSFTASQTQTCVDRCTKITPNGCDCFGCCAVPGVPAPVRLSWSCTAADFADPTKCAPCTQVTQCLNPCERCEACVGKPTIPDDCRASGQPPYTCPAGSPACGADGMPPVACPCGTTCVTGCCLPIDIVP